MQSHRTWSIRQLGAWIALWAVFALAIGPTLSHAINQIRGHSGEFAEVCTTRGIERVAFPSDSDVTGLVTAADSTSLPAPHDLSLEHCPLCGLSGHSLMPSPSSLILKLPALSDAPPRLFLLAPRLLFAWLQARPRGPPQHS